MLNRGGSSGGRLSFARKPPEAVQRFVETPKGPEEVSQAFQIPRGPVRGGVEEPGRTSIEAAFSQLPSWCRVSFRSVAQSRRVGMPAPVSHPPRRPGPALGRDNLAGLKALLDRV